MKKNSKMPHDAASEHAPIRDRLRTLAGRRILVIGDLILDRYIWGDVGRISPAAPVPIVRQRRTTMMLGGAANVARNLAAAGAHVRLAGLVGRDRTTQSLRSLLRRMRISTHGLVVDPDRPTTLKTSILAQGQQLLRLDVEDAAPLAQPLQAALVDAIAQQMDKIDAIVVSDYAKGVVCPTVFAAAVEAARKRDVPLVVDPKSTDFRRYRGADWLTPNLREATEAAGVELVGDAEIEREGRRLLRQFKGKGLVITRSGEGFSLLTARRHLRHPAKAREVFDVTGCGDTFISYFTLALASAWTPEDSATLANTAAGITIGKVGSAVVRPEELAAWWGTITYEVFCLLGLNQREYVEG